MLGVAVGTCKSQLHRARQLLGEQLADAGGGAMTTERKDSAARLDEALGRLPQGIEPARDLWPAVEAATRVAHGPPGAPLAVAGRGRRAAGRGIVADHREPVAAATSRQLASTAPPAQAT